MINIISLLYKCDSFFGVDCFHFVNIFRVHNNDPVYDPQDLKMLVLALKNPVLLWIAPLVEMSRLKARY